MKQIYILSLAIFYSIGICKAQGNALNFDGVDDEVILPHFERPDVFTLELWVKTDDFSHLGTLISWGTDDISTNSYTAELFVNQGALYYAEFDGTNFPGTDAGAGISDGEWHHVAVTRNNDTADNVNLYIDGNLISTATSEFDVITDNLRLGTVSYATFSQKFFNGTLDELKIWDIEKSEIEIQDGMNSELNGTENNLVLYTKFDQGIPNGDNASVTILDDIAPNDYDGTLNNFDLNGSSSNWVDGVGSMTSSVNNLTSLDLELFPNPSNDFIRINGLSNTENYTIYNALGREFKTGVVDSNTSIDIQDLRKGIYFLKFVDGNSFQFIKE
jgi:hypothetical protein